MVFSSVKLLSDYCFGEKKVHPLHDAKGEGFLSVFLCEILIPRSRKHKRNTTSTGDNNDA
jgi:hypothetical protein